MKFNLFFIGVFLLFFGHTPESFADAGINQNRYGLVFPDRQTLSSLADVVGTVEALQQAQVALQESGVVERVYVDVGDVVEKGQVLLQLRQSLVALELAETEVQARAAQAAFNESERLLVEAEKLIGHQSVSQTQLEARRAEHKQAALILEQTELIVSQKQQLLRRHTLHAPFSGVISRRQVNAGEWLSAGESPVQLTNTHQLRVRAHIPQQHYAQIRHSFPQTVT